ncbi:Ribonuclease H-like domain containing protein [Trema orientale]|uniref:Ribonuclease H-like domain containing protein n=1 Tax=Trema orientale TaxID=63057 RepID=A0A2P5BYW1_TREOI|nr:Ribonuclease H-like domain containing protein [Trema orientale]
MLLVLSVSKAKKLLFIYSGNVFMPSSSVPKEADDLEELMVYASVCFEHLWRERNLIVHGGARKNMTAIIREIHTSSQVYTDSPKSNGIARDSNGITVAAIAEKWACNHPLVAESKAILLALSFAQTKGWESVIVESDCKEVVESISGEEDDMPWMCADTIVPTRQLLARNSSWAVVFTPRKLNFVAHNLAAWSASRDLVGELNALNLPVIMEGDK